MSPDLPSDAPGDRYRLALSSFRGVVTSSIKSVLKLSIYAYFVSAIYNPRSI